jgi:predicted nucleic acid-binding protein
LYAFIESEELEKHDKARSIVKQGNIVVSVQIVNEVCVNLIRKASYSEEKIRRLIKSFYERYMVTDVDHLTLLRASEARERHRLSFWDSLIVASAMIAGARILYSEDMQSGYKIGDLRVVNPFI